MVSEVCTDAGCVVQIDLCSKELRRLHIIQLLYLAGLLHIKIFGRDFSKKQYHYCDECKGLNGDVPPNILELGETTFHNWMDEAGGDGAALYTSVVELPTQSALSY